MSVVGCVVSKDIEITWMITVLGVEEKTGPKDKTLHERQGVISGSGETVSEADEGGKSLAVVKGTSRKRQVRQVKTKANVEE